MRAHYPVCVGRSNPEWQTALGTFKLVEKKTNPEWRPTKSIVKAEGIKDEPVPPGAENPLGDRWMGWSKPGFGFHSTIAPQSIGTAVLARLRPPVPGIRACHVRPREGGHDDLCGVRAGRGRLCRGQVLPERVPGPLQTGNHDAAPRPEDFAAVRPAFAYRSGHLEAHRSQPGGRTAAPDRNRPENQGERHGLESAVLAYPGGGNVDGAGERCRGAIGRANGYQTAQTA